MNFIDHFTDIKDKLLQPEGTRATLKFSGIYIFSRLEDDTVFKIGMSEADIFKRLTNHKACYPFQKEYWLQYVIICTDTDYRENSKRKVSNETRNLETKLLSTPILVNIVDREKARYAGEQGRRPKEFRDAYEDALIQAPTTAQVRTKLGQALKTTLNGNRDLNWLCVVSFGKNGWNIIYNENGARGQPPINENNSQFLQRQLTRRQTQHKIDITKLEQLRLRLNRGLKIGDKVYVLSYDDDNKVEVYPEQGTIIAELICPKHGYRGERRIIGQNNPKVPCWQLKFPRYPPEEYPKEICYKTLEDAREQAQIEERLQLRGYGLRHIGKGRGHLDYKRSLYHSRIGHQLLKKIY